MGHIETAVGMFNAGEVLREYFRHYDIGTEDEKARRRSVMMPMVVVYILGIEVGIKALIERQGQKPDRIHDLEKLYGQLLNRTQERIGEKVRAIGINLSSVENLLKEHRNSLQEWRYVRDFRGNLVIHLDAIAATLKAIVDIHTEEYGAEREQKAQESKEQAGIPPLIQDAASKYVENVFTTNVTGAGKSPDELRSRHT